METLSTLTMLTVIVLNVIKTAGDCPRSCECKWKSGKESVFCVDANMTEIPKQLDSGTQVLVLTGNGLQRIGADEFFNASLLNLQKIFLSRCKLEFIHRFSFRKIINLVELDLSYNDLPSVPSHTFEFIKELRELRLNGNPIVRLLNNAFRMVPRLTKLDLSECRIVHVESKAFQGLENSLEWLKLDKNKITNIKPQILVNLGNLHGLELAGNPWNCSCGLRTLREWMLTQNVPHSVPPICKEPPRLFGKVWDKLELDEFACTPKIEAIASRKSGEEGSNVTMSCSINGIPEPSIRWLRKNHIIANLSAAGSGARKKLYIVQIAKETSNLTILAADAQDNGVYVCRAENKAGKSEANITLTVLVKPAVKIWSLRMMIAVGVVSLLFATAVGLLTYCAWSLRKRKSYIRHPVIRRDFMDGYEMNHKNPMGYNKIRDYGNCCSSAATQNANCRQLTDENSGIDVCGSRTSDATARDRTVTEQLSTPRLRKSDEMGWTFSRMSEAEDGPAESRHCSSWPGSHISGPRGQGTPPGEESCSEDSSFAMSSNVLEARPPYSRSEKNRESSIFFTSGVADIQKKFPDLLELSRNKENFINNNSSSTMPGKKSYKMKRSRRGSFGSESQSPLLPASSGDSCDSNFPFGGRSFFDKYTSLPTSPSDPSQTPILHILDGSSSVFAQSPTTLKYQSWELEKFLKEYRHLQDQLFKMKESCENLKESNLKFREGEGESNAVESATISKTLPPVYLEDASGLPGFLDEANNFGALYSGSGFLEEDNNNPKSIVPNSSSLQPVLANSDAYWPSGGHFLKTFPSPNSRSSCYKS